MKQLLLILITCLLPCNLSAKTFTMDCRISGIQVITNENGNFNTFEGYRDGIKAGDILKFEYGVNQWRVHFSLTDPATSQILLIHMKDFKELTPEDLSIMNFPKDADREAFIILGLGELITMTIPDNSFDIGDLILGGMEIKPDSKGNYSGLYRSKRNTDILVAGLNCKERNPIDILVFHSELSKALGREY